MTTRRLSEKEIITIAKDIVLNDIYLSQAVKKYRIPQATLHRSVTDYLSEIDPNLAKMVKATFKLHRIERQNKFISEYASVGVKRPVSKNKVL